VIASSQEGACVFRCTVRNRMAGNRFHFEFEFEINISETVIKTETNILLNPLV